MQKAIIYCRVSSLRQKLEGHGLDSQEHRCREYAERKSYEVVKIFHDSFTGEGDFMNRPAMATLLAFLDKNPTTNYVVIFDDLKRLARDTVFHLKLRNEFGARGAKVECLNFTFDDSPEGRFVETILASQGELERKQNQRQVIQKMKARLERGYWAFGSPRGYRMVKHPIHGQLLSKIEDKAALIKEALEGFAGGRFENQVDVRKFLQMNKFQGVRYVSLDTVKALLTNPLYAGYIEYKKWGVSRRVGHHEAIIDAETFERIQDKLAGKIKIRSRKDNTKEFPLRGFVLCSECVKPLTASWAKGRNGRHPYYHCKTKDCVMKGKTIKRKVMEDEFEDKLRAIRPKEKTLVLAKEVLMDIWNKRMADVEKIQESEERSLDEVRANIRTFLYRIGKTENENLIKTYEAAIEKLSNEEAILENQMRVIRSAKPDFGTALDITFGFLKSPYTYWKKDDLQSKHLVLKLVFSERLTYERGKGLQTASLAFPLKVFELSSMDNSDLVEMGGIEPPCISV